MDEMTQLDRLRSEIPTPELSGAAERRLLAEIATSSQPRPARRQRRRVNLGLGLASGLAAAVTMGVVITNGDSGDPGQTPTVQPYSMAAVTLQRAADNTSKQEELHPKPGQFLVFESQTMDPVDSNNENGHSRFLSRSKRTVWLPVDGSSLDGVLFMEVLPPKPYPGWPLPPEAKQEVGTRGPDRLADFDQRAEYLRTDYAYLSSLPTDTAGMRKHLYLELEPGARADYEAWDRVGSMLAEGYLPAAQRAALFRAAATIPGVETVKKSEDAAGREGVAVAMVSTEAGERQEYIFDLKTYQYLGQRTVVVDADKAEAPVGSVLTATALLKVSVADSAPVVNGG